EAAAACACSRSSVITGREFGPDTGSASAEASAAGACASASSGSALAGRPSASALFVESLRERSPDVPRLRVLRSVLLRRVLLRRPLRSPSVPGIRVAIGPRRGLAIVLTDFGGTETLGVDDIEPGGEIGHRRHRLSPRSGSVDTETGRR